MGIIITNLDAVVNNAVTENVDIQATQEAKQVVLDAVIEAQKIVDDGLVAITNSTDVNKNVLDTYTIDKKAELSTYSAQVADDLTDSVDVDIARYDSNALARITQYNDNYTNTLLAYNANDAVKLQQYNENHIERLENINYAYADRIVQMLKTTRVIGMIDEYVAETDTHMCTFLSTDDDAYIYYANGTKLELNVDYTVYDTQTIELVVKANPYDVITQINTRLLRDMLISEEVVFRTEVGQPKGVSGLDENGQVPSTQLPSYVDDVIEVATYADLPTVGESGKIYVVVADETSMGDTSSYRWTGTTYAMVSNTLNAADVKALYEANGDTNAYTDADKLFVGAGTALTTTASTLPTAINELQGHVVSDGSDHTFIDQNVTTTGTPRFNSIQLNGGVGTQGLMTWNPDEETIDIVTNGSILQVGQEFLVHIRNNTATNIPNGTVVMISGTIGNSGRVLVAPMDPNNAANTIRLIGVTTTEVEAGADGKATILGKIRGFNTTGADVGEVWANNDSLYVHPTLLGKFTNQRPTVAQVDIPIGLVLNAHTNGTIIVRVLPINRNEISPSIVANYYNKATIDLLLAAQNEASEISVTPQGNLSAETVQSALEELQEQLDTLTIVEEW